MTLKMRVLLCAVLLAVLALPAIGFADEGEQDRVQFFKNIDVAQDQQVGDAVCLFCSIRLAGTAKGDVVAILGSIDVQGQANGDVVSVGGRIRLGEDASVKGDTVGIGGGVLRHPNAVANGEVVSQSGPLIVLGLFFGIVVVPLLPLILIIWLIVWLVRRNQRPQYAYPPYRQ